MPRDLPFDRIPPPFPRWYLAVDPVARRHADNGLFQAFHEARRRRHSVVAVLALLGFSQMPGFLAALVIMAVVVAVSEVGFGLGVLILLASFVGFAVMHSRLVASRRRRPIYIEDHFVPSPNAGALEPIRLFPLGVLELGEAILLERFQREWFPRTVQYWVLVAAAYLAVVLPCLPFGPGDAILAGGFLVAGILWRPVVMLQQFSRMADRLVERVASVSIPDRIARWLQLVSSFFSWLLTTPLLLAMIGVEIAILYILAKGLLDAAIRMILSRPESGVVMGELNLVTHEISHGIIGILLMLSGLLARPVANSMAHEWANRSEIAIIDLSRMLRGALDTEE